jgi:hypothetical protein
MLISWHWRVLVLGLGLGHSAELARLRHPQNSIKE